MNSHPIFACLLCSLVAHSAVAMPGEPYAVSFPVNPLSDPSLPELNWNSESKPVLLLSKRAFDRRNDGSSRCETLKGFAKFA